MEDNNTPEAPTPCTAGCGFYGNKIYNNMCSKCFKEQDERNKKDSSNNNSDTRQQEEQPEPCIQKVVEQVVKVEEVSPPPAAAAAKEEVELIKTTTTKKQEEEQEVTVVVASSSPSSNETIQQKETEQEEEKEPSRPIQKNKGRCFSCRIKIPLAKQLTNKCRCEYVFCDTHRYPDKHDCNFDHAKNDKDILLKNNPKLHDKPRGGNSFNRLDSI